jgi:hypothetical protein
MIPTSKICSNPDCFIKEPQPLENFNKNQKGRLGLYCWCKTCTRAANRNRYAIEEERRKHWKSALQRKYWPQLTYEEAFSEFEKLRLAQDSVCAIWRRPETEIDKKINKFKQLNVDHCHKTGKVRGLLCGKCNRGLGQLEDSSILLIYALEYIQKHEKATKTTKTGTNAQL